MIQLSNGNSYSGVSVVPKNWKQASASLKSNWYITYRYYAKDREAPKQVKIKSGINRYKTLEERRYAVKVLMEQEIRLIEKEGYNPFTNTTSNADNNQSDYIIDPQCGLVESLRLANERLKVSAYTQADLKTVLNGFGIAAQKANLDKKPIAEIERRHIVIILDEAARSLKNWSDEKFNKYRANIMMIFNELVNIQTIAINPVTAIKKKATIKKVRLTLSNDEREKVKSLLSDKFPTFYRFVQIFFHSGARITELLNLKREDVCLKEMYFMPTVNKGKRPTIKKRPIKKIALPYWEEIMNEAKSGQFLFCKNLRPGKKPNTLPQISRRWRTHIKTKLGISADFYSLKHLNLDEVTNLYSIELASKLAGHTTTKMIESVYAVGHEERVMQKIREIGNEF